MRTTIYKVNNKVLVYSTGNYIQNLAITLNGKQSKTNICIWITLLLA